MRIPAFDPRPQNEPLLDDIKAAIAAVLESGQFIGGAALERFEGHFAEFVGSPHAVGVSSGTDALLLALLVAGIGPDTVVLTTPFTFFATASTVHRLGARVRFADIADDTLDLDPARVEEELRDSAVTALLPVHLYGRYAPIGRLAALAAEYGATLVEDVAQALGASSGARGAGTTGRFGTFSFYPTKNLGGIGEGGMIVCPSAEDAERLRQGRNHGMTQPYLHDFVGGNFRLDAIQAAALDVKLAQVPSWNEERRRLAQRYDEAFDSHGLREHVRTPAPVAEPNEHVHHQYVIRVRDRDALREHLASAGVGSAVYYPVPLHLQACFRSLGYSKGAFPVAERASEEVLALPMFPGLSESAAGQVVATIAAHYRRSRASAR